MSDQRVVYLPPRRPKDECGVFGIYGAERAPQIAYYGLFALQHRGQESAGIAASDGQRLKAHRGMGLVSEVFDRSLLEGWESHLAIGHVRYSTTGSSSASNAQPLVIRYRHGRIALAHNGNLTNAAALRDALESRGSIFQTTTDTEVIAHLVAHQCGAGLEAALVAALAQVEGAYALVVMNEHGLIGVRDPNGIRPLSLGRLGDAWVLASETCAFDIIGAEFVRDVAPGEMVIIDQTGLRSRQALPAGRPSLCVFEYIYFARPDSNLDGRNVHSVRKALGAHLWRDYPVEADLVTGVPDSSISAASGFAEAAGIPFEMGLVKNRYIGRTFIQPDQGTRTAGAKIKYNPLRKVLEGKRVVLVDDSIVRGTTIRQIVRLLRDAGALEVHLRISSPPYTNSCYFGIDTSAPEELVAASKTVEEIRRETGADSLAYLTVEAMAEAIGLPADRSCVACFTGEYPVNIRGAHRKLVMEGEENRD